MNDTPALNLRDSRGDLLGLALISACALHCVAGPTLLAFSPWLAGEASESMFLAATCGVGLIVLGLGFRRHGRVLPLGLGLLGLVCCIMGGESLRVGGALLLGAGHLLNARARCQCEACPQPS